VKEHSFTAARAGSSIRLRWTAAGETDDYFEVERSGNGIDFSKIGEVKAIGLASESSYEFFDRQPLTGTNYYRLKTVEKSGGFTYTRVVSEKMQGTVAVQVYPNPASNRITVQLPGRDGEVLLKLTDMGGRMLSSSRVAAVQHTMHHSIDISHLPRGQYLLSANEASVVFLKQ
jgi:hypothetical protein